MMNLFNSIAILLVIACCVFLSSSSSVSALKRGPRAPELYQEEKHFRDYLIRTAKCQCSNASLCAPLKTKLANPEVYAYATNSTGWKVYDWRYLTTVSLFDAFDPEILCVAHSHNTRVTYSTRGIEPSQLCNVTARREYVEHCVAAVVAQNLDGINLDAEYPLKSGSPEVGCLSQVAQEMNSKLKAAVPTSSFSIDLAWSTDCIDGRCYDYKALVDASDFSIAMLYDVQSQQKQGNRSRPANDCLALPNSPAWALFEGVKSFLDLPVNADKIVLGAPFYGYSYPCIIGSTSPISHAPCRIKSVPFRGVPCSDAAGGQVTSHDLIKLSKDKSVVTTSILINTSMEGNGSYATFNTVTEDKKGQKTVHKILFDVPATLREKYLAAKKLGLRGTAIWSIDQIGPLDSHDARKFAAEMWDAFKVWW